MFFNYFVFNCIIIIKHTCPLPEFWGPAMSCETLHWLSWLVCPVSGMWWYPWKQAREKDSMKKKLSYNVLQLILQIFCSYKSSSVLLVYKVAPNCCWIPLDPLCSSLSKFSRILPLLLPLATELPDTAGAIEMSESQFTPHKYGAQHMTCRGKKQTNITWEQILNLWPWYIWFFFLHTMCGEHV